MQPFHLNDCHLAHHDPFYNAVSRLTEPSFPSCPQNGTLVFCVMQDFLSAGCTLGFCILHHFLRLGLSIHLTLLLEALSTVFSIRKELLRGSSSLLQVSLCLGFCFCDLFDCIQRHCITAFT